MMALLEQDSAHCNSLWTYYMKEKNRIFNEALAETISNVNDEDVAASIKAPDSPDGNRNTRSTRKTVHASKDTNAVYTMKKEVLEKSVLDGSLRAAALAARRAAKEAEVRKTDNLKGIEIKSSIAVVTTREIDIESDEVNREIEENIDSSL